jgi:hypothetical protein
MLNNHAPIVSLHNKGCKHCGQAFTFSKEVAGLFTKVNDNYTLAISSGTIEGQ